MSDVRRILALASLALLLPFCGYRERGLEVALDVTVAPGCADGALDLERVELLPCPDVPPAAALLEELAPVRIAYAHDQASAMGPVLLMLPGDRATATLPMTPGSYCDVRVHFGSAARPALTRAAGEAAERETVLRLVDASGAPTRLLLSRAPDRAAIAIDLGAFSEDATPAAALGEIIAGARATLVTH